MQHILYFVNNGIDYSHRKMNVKSFSTLKSAIEFFQTQKESGVYSAKVGEIVRVAYESQWSTEGTEKLLKCYGMS